MKVRMYLPALAEATSPLFRPLKYSLFPPLGLATLAAYIPREYEVTIHDEHVENLDLDVDADIVVIEVYVTSAKRAYRIADHFRAHGAHVCLGGLHVTACPDEAAQHADTIFTGPGESTWPTFLADFRHGVAKARYDSRVHTLDGAPHPRRELIDRSRYLTPNSLVVSRGCPHACEFCYKEAFFAGGRSHYTRRVESALEEIETLQGRHLFFLDDHLFGDQTFASHLFEGMRGMGRVWQAAGTVATVLTPGLIEQAAEAGLRSLFVGFETLSSANLAEQGKRRNLGLDYAEAVKRLHDLGVMVNASFVFGMDGDTPDVFDRTVEWALDQGIETATFHILTPYPGTRLHTRLSAEGRITVRDWDRYDTRHAVFEPRGMTATQLETGYRRAYRDFYAWGSILRSTLAVEGAGAQLRHAAYAIGWKKLEPVWDVLIKAHRVGAGLPLLEKVLGGAGGRTIGAPERAEEPWVRALRGETR